MIEYGTDLLLTFEYDDATPVSLTSMEVAGAGRRSDASAARHVPLVELLTVADGRRPGFRYTQTLVGSRLRYRAHTATDRELRIVQHDATTGLVVTSVIVPTPRGADSTSRTSFRSWTELQIEGANTVLVQAVSSFATAAFLHDGVGLDDLDLLTAESEWSEENRWTRQPLRDAGVGRLEVGRHPHNQRHGVAVTGHSSWSTDGHLPIGVLASRDDQYALAWQIEHNGPWRFEIGELNNGAYLTLLGPTDLEHHWLEEVSADRPFVSVPVSIVVVAGTADDAFAALTWQRRSLRREHRQNATLPLIYNDYMNTLMGDPTTAKLLPLIDKAAGVGADYFMIDAGWYDDGGNWWDSVGAWLPSTTRFPQGLSEVIEHITGHGMVPGLWLEPEVVGVRSPVAESLPQEAFLQRRGTRIVDHERYLLDLRHPAARAHLDEVVDRLVDGLGVGYFKLDYNVTPGAGTDLQATSVGAGLLAHNRAYLSWLDGVLDRHPDLVVENCGSGAMRQDYAMLSRLALQSTSDQEDPVLYSAITAAAPSAVLPEQAGNWAYPQPEMTDEEIVYALVNGIPGRLYLSGHLGRMSEDQLSLVRAGIGAHRELCSVLPSTVPFWPLGLPKWTDPWLCLGLRTDDVAYLALWKRSSTAGPVNVPLDALGAVDLEVVEHFPRRETAVSDRHSWTLDWDQSARTLTADAAQAGLSARVLRLTWT